MEDSLPETVFEEIDFSVSEKKIRKRRKESLGYLVRSLAGALQLPVSELKERIGEESHE